MSESSGSNPKFTPEELAALELEIPAFKRRKTLSASTKLRGDLDDPSKRGGVYSPLDPINQENLLGFGTPNRPIELQDIRKPTTDTRLNASQTEQVITDIRNGKHRLVIKEK